MKANYDIDLDNVNEEPDMPYCAVAESKETGERYVVLVNSYGVTYIDSYGDTSMSGYDFFKEYYKLVHVPTSLSITFRNFQ